MLRQIIHLDFFKKQTTIAWVIFFAMFLISFRFFFFKSFDSVGHNWDWGFPALPYMFERIRELSAYTWSLVGLGRSGTNLQAHIPVNEAMSFLGWLLGIKGTLFLVFLFISAGAFLSFKRLLDFFGKEKSVIHYFPSGLYAFSPFLLNEIIGGSWYMWVSYAFAPFLFLSLVQYVRQGTMKSLFSYSIAASFVVISLQNFVTLELVAALFFVVSTFITRVNFKEILYQIKSYTWAHIFFVLINLYWIIPFFDSWNVFYTMVTDTSFTGDFEGVRTITQNVLHIFLMTGYLDRNMYFYSVPSILSILLSSLVLFAWVAAFAVFLFRNEEGLSVFKKSVLLWFLILVSSVLVIKGGNVPFASFTMGIFQNFPLMALYRSPQHLMFAAAFIIPLLMSTVTHYYLARGVPKKVVIGFWFLVVLFWTSGWWYNGDLGSEMLREKNRDHVDFYSLSPELKKVYDYNERSDLVHRILFLPTSFSPDFLPNDYQNKGQGGQPEYTHLKNSTLNWEFGDIAKRIDDKFCYQEDFNFLNYLSLTNTRYVYLREDIYPHHSECGVMKVWDMNTVKGEIHNMPGLTPLSSVTGFYKVDDEYFLQHVFIPDQVIVSDQEPEQLSTIVSGDYRIGTGIFFEKQNLGKSEESWEVLRSYKKVPEAGITLEFRRVNPTKYKVHLENIREAFPLILSESFHSGWRIYPSRIETSLMEREFVSKNIHGVTQNDNLPSGEQWETWFQKSFYGGASHFLANGYANAWIIDPEVFCSENPQSCVLNEGGTYDIVLTLEFWPQRLIYFGGFLSAVFLVMYVMVTRVISWLRRKNTTEREM